MSKGDLIGFTKTFVGRGGFPMDESIRASSDKPREARVRKPVCSGFSRELGSLHEFARKRATASHPAIIPEVYRCCTSRGGDSAGVYCFTLLLPACSQRLCLILRCSRPEKHDVGGRAKHPSSLYLGVSLQFCLLIGGITNPSPSSQTKVMLEALCTTFFARAFV